MKILINTTLVKSLKLPMPIMGQIKIFYQPVRWSKNSTSLIFLKMVNNLNPFTRKHNTSKWWVFGKMTGLSFLLNFFLILSWSIANWQYSDNFRWTEKWPSYIKHVSILSQTPSPSRLPHDIEQQPLCYTVGPCWLSIKYSSVFMSIPNSLTVPFPHPSLPGNCKFVLCESVSVL